MVLDLYVEDGWRNVYAGKGELRPPGAPTTDPDNISNVRRIRAVVVSGRLLSRAELDQILVQISIAVRSNSHGAAAGGIGACAYPVTRSLAIAGKVSSRPPEVEESEDAPKRKPKKLIVSARRLNRNTVEVVPAVRRR